MDYIKENLINEIKEGIKELGSWYVDWGASSDIYRNCPGRAEADEIAAALEAQGYSVTLDLMGLGSTTIPAGTPICYRIRK